jgi:hypothetical protein
MKQQFKQPIKVEEKPFFHGSSSGHYSFFFYYQIFISFFFLPYTVFSVSNIDEGQNKIKQLAFRYGLYLTKLIVFWPNCTSLSSTPQLGAPI